MQIGLMLEGQDGLNWDNWKRLLRVAEDSGYQCLFRSDHFTNAQGPIKDALELWTSLTYAASVTTRLEFGSLVTPITFRHPALIAQYAAAIDVLSDGRLVLGMGIGWQEREHHMFDLYFPDLQERYARFEDALQVVTRLLGSTEPSSYEGQYYSLRDAQILMKRTPMTTLLIGGNGKQKTLRFAARYANEWNAVYLSKADFKERTDLLDTYLTEVGRNPEDVKRSLMTRVIYGKDEAQLQEQISRLNVPVEDLQKRGVLVGTGQAIVDQLGEWQAVGLQRIMLQWLDLDDVDRIESLAQHVLPHFQ